MYLPVKATIATLAVLLLITLSLTRLAPDSDPASEKTTKQQSSMDQKISSQPTLTITYKPIHSPDDIEALTPPLIKPVAYTRVSTLAALEVSTKKQKFFDMILPAVLISKQRLLAKRIKLAEINAMPTPDEKAQAWLQKQFKLYKAKDSAQLKSKLADHPTSIILAQAALETGWGTSRFFLEGNNIFGVWSFNAKEPRMRASQTREGKPIYVKRYSSLIEAVDDYFVTIARGGPYREFRRARTQTQDALKLIKYLNYYSEIGDEYVQRLRSIITRNKMLRFDSYQLQTADSI